MEEIGPEEYWRTAADYRMKNIGAEWRNLAEGLLRIEALEAQVRAEWGLQLEMARRATEEAGRQRNRRLRRAGLIAALVLALLLLTVSSYFSDGNKLDSIASSKEVQEARIRAVWHPHPDGPPQN
jgi:hypothetical protein